MIKKAYLSVCLLLTVIALAACHASQTKTNHHNTSKTAKTTHKQEKVGKSNTKTPDQIDKEEGIDVEQVVVSISDDGFVTSHGDHYHFYNGNVPFDSIFSSEVLAPEDYSLNTSDIINDVKNGYVIKLDDHYYVYFTDKEQADNLRQENE